MLNSSLTVRIRHLCKKISRSQMVSASEQLCVDDCHASFKCTLFSTLVCLCHEGTSADFAKAFPELIEDVLHVRFEDLA